MPKLVYVSCDADECEECETEKYRLELVEKCREQYIINDEIKTEMRRRLGKPVPHKLAPAYLGLRRTLMKNSVRGLERYLEHLQLIEGFYVSEKWKKSGKIKVTMYNYHEQDNQDDISGVLKEFWRNIKKACTDISRIALNKLKRGLGDD